MRKVILSDVTLRESESSANHSLSFKEKIEIAKQMDKLHCDIIEMPKIKNTSTDVLLIKTIASLMKHSEIAVDVGYDAAGVETAYNCAKCAKKFSLKVSLPMSAVQMEFKCGKKPPVVMGMVSQLVAECKKYSENVEFCAEDAVRGESTFLYQAIDEAIKAGATRVTVCDSEGTMFPSEFGKFIADIIENVPSVKDVTLGVEVVNSMNMATASAFAAIEAGASQVKITADNFNFPTVENIMKIFSLRGDSIKVSSKIRTTEIQRVTGQIKRMLNTSKSENTPFETGVNEDSETNTTLVVSDDGSETLTLDKNDTIATVIKAVKKIGYDLSPEDNANVYEAFKRVAVKKDFVGTKELEAIIASSALQVPSIYSIGSYVINSGNIITATANIKLVKNGTEISGVSVGDGPIDAAFLAIEQIIGHHYELDDFQIKAVTEGREAMGHALVKLRSSTGKLYSGTGISTDIIGASIRAYVSALNKIAYEEG